MADTLMATSDPFTSVLRQPDLLEKLVQFPEVRQHLADPGFMEQIEKLRALANDPKMDSGDLTKTAEIGQKIAQASHKDPRVMQALMALHGQRIEVEEKDLKRAEDFGDMKRREPVQLEQLQLVHNLQDPDEARQKGNDYFKAGDMAAALAHYEKGLELLKARAEAPCTQLATLLSNSAACLLKLRWPDRAKRCATQAIVAVWQKEEAADFDQSKLFYRRALACEQLQEFNMAVEDMARALQAAKKSGLSLPQQHMLKTEQERLKKLQAASQEEAEKKRQQQANEKVAEVQRMQGEKLRPKVQGDGLVSAEYLAEQDFTHWTRQKVAAALPGLRHKCQSGATIEVVELQEDPSKIQASITTKKGCRALYYEMDLHAIWKGQAAPKLAPKEGPRELQGLIRVYNIAHDTKFELGGDENTSYMYQLGWDQRLTGAWVDDLKAEAAELFDLIAEKVDGVIKELRKK